MGINSEEHIKLMQEYQSDSHLSYESRFWTEMYVQEKNKVLLLQEELKMLKEKCKECGIGNDHKA
tara:strand:- start:193 stop:387 length:195 start_codon:yes stop_codon:yes gene_type:complete